MINYFFLLDDLFRNTSFSFDYNTAINVSIFVIICFNQQLGF